MTITELLEKIRSSETTDNDAGWLEIALRIVVHDVCNCSKVKDIAPHTHSSSCQWAIAFKD